MDIMGFIKSDTKVKEGLVDACQIVDGYLRYKLLWPDQTFINNKQVIDKGVELGANIWKVMWKDYFKSFCFGSFWM